ncbi:MAG: hypothetical protein HY319_09070 [Armatimonadetes bacterium]|nr:hypothetical protein [Armatimonadota bacterium]
MSLDTIRQAVTRDAQAEAGRVLQEAEQKTAERLAALKAAAQKELETRFLQASRAIEGKYSRLLSQKKSAANKQLLEARNAGVRRLFEQARQEILAWPASVYGPVMQRFLEEAAGSSPGRARCHPDDRKLFEELCQKLNRGRPPAAALALDGAKLADRGGFVFVGPDFEVDQTLSTRLADLAQELTPALAAELFG